MSQYGIIPLDKVPQIKQKYDWANPSTWMPVVDNVQYGGVEDEQLSDDQKKEIVTLGGQWFENAAAYNAFLNSFN